MAIFNRALDFLNGGMGPVERPQFQPPMDVQPYVDDIFDPLFNEDVVRYNRERYGLFGAIPAGYAQMWENALTGQKGILGPGMGILGTFGRSMDKADDFILGGLTEGVNAIGRFTGTNDAPVNPIKNIFVDDANYEGSDLLAAMGNAMGKLAGGAKLSRADFNTLPEQIQSGVINLATDPGYMGGSIARANPANRVASALDEYDNIMANVAGNMTLPGAKAAASAGLRRFIRLVGGAENAPLFDYDINGPENVEAAKIASDYAAISGLDGLSDFEKMDYQDIQDAASKQWADAWNQVLKSQEAPESPKPSDPIQPAPMDIDSTLDAYAGQSVFDMQDIMGRIFERPDSFKSPSAPEYIVNRAYDSDLTYDVLNPRAFPDSQVLDTYMALMRYRDAIDARADESWNLDTFQDQVEEGNLTPMLIDAFLNEHGDKLAKYIEERRALQGTGRNPEPIPEEILAPMRQQLSEMFGSDTGLNKFIRNELNVTPNDPNNLAFLTVSDAGRRRVTSQQYYDLGRQIIDESAKELTPRAHYDGLDGLDRIAIALSDYTKPDLKKYGLDLEGTYRYHEGMSDVEEANYFSHGAPIHPYEMEGMFSYGSTSARQTLNRLRTALGKGSMSQRGDVHNSEVFAPLDAYLAARGTKTPQYKAFLAAVTDSLDGRSKAKFLKAMMGDGKEDILSAYIDYFNIFGAKLPDDAKLADIARWYSKHKKDMVDISDLFYTKNGETNENMFLEKLNALKPSARRMVERVIRENDAIPGSYSPTLRKKLNELLNGDDKGITNLNNVRGAYKRLIQQWYSNIRRVDEYREFYTQRINNPYVNKSYKEAAQAHLDDLDTLERFIHRMEKLELASSPTIPKFLLDYHRGETDWTGDRGIARQIISMNDILEASTSSAGIGNDMKSLMDWLYEDPNVKTDEFGNPSVPYEWRIRKNAKILANDFDDDGFYRRPEGEMLIHFKRPNRYTEEQWKAILAQQQTFRLHPEKSKYKVTGTPDAFDRLAEIWNPNKHRALLSSIYVKPWVKTAEGAWVPPGPESEAIPLIVKDATKTGVPFYRFNPELSPEAMRFSTFYSNDPKLTPVINGMTFDDSVPNQVAPVYINRDAYNYFKRYPENMRDIKFQNGLVVAERTAEPSDVMPKLSTPEVVELATAPTNPSTVTYEALKDDLLADTVDWFGLTKTPDPLDPGDVKFIKDHGTPKQQTLFAYLARMATSRMKAARLAEKTGFLGKRTQSLLERAKQLTSTYKPEAVWEYIRRMDASEDIVVKADDFVGSLVNSEGFKMKTYAKNDPSIPELRRVLTHNVNIVNTAAGAKVLKLVDVFDSETGRGYIGYAFDGSNINVKKDLAKLYSFFRGTELEGLQDVRFQVGRGMKVDDLDPKMVADLQSLFGDANGLLNEYTGRLGFTPYSDGYVRHSLTDDAVNDFHFVEHKKKLKVMDSLDVSRSLGDIREFDARMRKTLGTKVYGRSWYGDIDLYGTGFSHDLNVIMHDTFTKGALDNADASMAQELFFNGNFSLKRNFRDADTVMAAIRQSGSSNATNLQIVVPIEKDGVLVGFKRIDPWNDDAIRQAYENDNAILAPTSVFGHLDRILKKEAKMSNGFYRFVQKYLTVPFKMGVISNLGFLFGNVQDASFKQVESFMRRYGTSLEEECSNAAMAYKFSVDLQNKFSDTIDQYVAFLNGDGYNKNDFRLSLATLKKHGTIDAALVTGNPKFRDEFTKWMSMQPKEAVSAANLYIYANAMMNSGTFENNYLDLEDLMEVGNADVNVYDKPLHIVDRVLYGDRSGGEMNIKHGPFKGKHLKKFGIVTNPGTNAVLKPSNDWEHTTRLATILNYLQHEGYTDERLSAILEQPFDPSIRERLTIDMVQGIDMMNHANFDYDNVTEFMDKVSYVVPFPTFYLKNIAHWMEVFSNNPQMIDDIVSFQEGLWQNKDTESDEFAAEAKGRGAYPIGGTHHFDQGIVKQSPINSMFSAFSAANNFKEDFAFRTNPLLRPITRHLQDPEDVKYRPYSTNPYEKNIKKSDPNFSELAYMFHQLNPYDRYLNTYLRTPRKIATNDWQASDFLPSVFQPDFSKKSR